MRFSGVQFERFVRFVIWQESDRAFAGENSIADADPGMVHEPRANMHFADLEIHRLKFFDFDFSRQIVKRHREERSCHLSFEDFAQTAAGTVVTKNLDLIFVVVRRYEKRESLNVVPMNVGNKQTEINRARSEFILQSKAELANSRSGVEHYELAVSANFDASGVAAVADSRRARNWN